MGLFDFLDDDDLDFKVRMSGDKESIRVSAEMGDCIAIRTMLEDAEDTAEQIYWTEKLAEFGDDPGAMFNMGIYYKNGGAVERDFEKALNWMKKADEYGDEDAEKYIKKLEPVVETKKKAESGDPSGMYEYALVLMRLGGDENDTEAVEWANKAIDAGETKAYYVIGTCYQRGSAFEEDEKKAVEYYRKAAEAGCGDAYNALGNCYANGKGVEKNLEKAEECYRKGADLDNSNSRVNLAGMIFAGDADGDKNEAAEWLLAAAVDGDESALQNLYRIIHGGYIADETDAEGIKSKIPLVEKIATTLDDADIDYATAVYYTTNDEDGKMIDPERSRYWYAKAAEKGHMMARGALNFKPMWEEYGYTDFEGWDDDDDDDGNDDDDDDVSGDMEGFVDFLSMMGGDGDLYDKFMASLSDEQEEKFEWLQENDSDEDGYDDVLSEFVDGLSENQKMLFAILFVNTDEDDDE